MAAALWIGALVFLILIFVAVAIVRSQGGSYDNRDSRYVPPQPVYPPPPAYPQPVGRTNGHPVLVFMLVVLLAFVGLVLWYSVAVQAWIP